GQVARIRQRQVGPEELRTLGVRQDLGQRGRRQRDAVARGLQHPGGLGVAQGEGLGEPVQHRLVLVGPDGVECRPVKLVLALEPVGRLGTNLHLARRRQRAKGKALLAERPFRRSGSSSEGQNRENTQSDKPAHGSHPLFRVVADRPLWNSPLAHSAERPHYSQFQTIPSPILNTTSLQRVSRILPEAPTKLENSSALRSSHAWRQVLLF